MRPDLVEEMRGINPEMARVMQMAEDAFAVAQAATRALALVVNDPACASLSQPTRDAILAVIRGGMR